MKVENPTPDGVGRVTIKYQTPYMVRLRDGTECMAMLLRLNKYSGHVTVWKRLDDVPKKKKYIPRDEVIAIAVYKVN